MSKCTLLAVFLLVGTGFASHANAVQKKDKQEHHKMQSGQMSSINPDSKCVARELAIDSTEIALTQDALPRIKDQRVKDFAHMLIDDHKKDARKLTDLRDDQKIAQIVFTTRASKTADSLMNKIQSGRSGKNFDVSFLEMQVKNHQQAIKRITKAESQVSNDGLKEHLKQDLSIMQKHLDSAHALIKDLKTSQTGR